MITVTTTRTYYDATHFGSDEKGALRVYKGSEVIAEYAAGEDITVSQEAPLLVNSGFEMTAEQAAEFSEHFTAELAKRGGRLT